MKKEDRSLRNTRRELESIEDLARAARNHQPDGISREILTLLARLTQVVREDIIE